MATKYKCPYCDHMRMTKDELIGHIDEEHREMIPEGWSAGRLAFKIIYKKDHGTCVVCKKPTEWNDKRYKYQRLCGDPNCRKALRDAALKNHIKVYKCKTLLNSPMHQEKMLRNRKISGEYKFRDGGKIGYVGSYEKNFLEFMDKTLDVKSDEIIEPGPVFEYDMEGKKHFWITDFLYIPYNLVIEVKDGGDNPNKRNMPIYRKKEAIKDKLITEKGTYNYLKLTNNNFAQLLEIFAVMRMQMMNDEPENRRVVIRVNEDTDLLNEGWKQDIKDIGSFAQYIGSTWIFNSATIQSLYNCFIVGPTLGTLRIIFGLFDFTVNQIGLCAQFIYDIITKKKYKPNIIPLDTRGIPDKFGLLCINTHLVNIPRDMMYNELEFAAQHPQFLGDVITKDILDPMFWLLNLKEQYDARDFLLIDRTMEIEAREDQFKDTYNTDAIDKTKELKVIACNDGVVIFTNESKLRDDPRLKAFSVLTNAGGNVVIIMHHIGLYSVYCHLKTGSIKVKPGDIVKQGQPIGIVGTTGNSTSPHLHFELAYDTSLGTFTLGRLLDDFNFKCHEGRLIWYYDWDQKEAWDNFKRNVKYKDIKHGQIPNMCLVK